MSGLDETLARWRRETEQLKPSAALMAELNALALAQTPAPAAPLAAAKAAGVTKGALLVVAVALLGVAGAVLVWMWSRAPAQSEAPVPCRPAVVAEPPAPVPATKLPEPAMQAPAMVPSPRADAVPALKRRPPARLEGAVGGLAMTCAAQRNELVELVREAAADDPEAAAAALTRWTLLCRALSGPARDSHRWFWPWAAPSGAGTACNTVMTDPSCADGDNITQSIDAAARCVLTTTPGSCARRGALLQAVFANCEAFTHRPDSKNRAAVDEALSRLTGEFGAALVPAAWCLNPAAKAEALRRR